MTTTITEEQAKPIAVAGKGLKEAVGIKCPYLIRGYEKLLRVSLGGCDVPPQMSFGTPPEESKVYLSVLKRAGALGEQLEQHILSDQITLATACEEYLRAALSEIDDLRDWDADAEDEKDRVAAESAAKEGRVSLGEVKKKLRIRP